LSSQEHRKLEQVANAVLYASGGDALLLREGIRERGNVVRDTVPFEVKRRIEEDADNNTQFEIELLQTETKRSPEPTVNNESSAPTSADDHPPGGDTTLPPLPVSRQQQQRAGKVTLKLEKDEDNETRKASEEPKRPLIYVQDDDPEYDDMDEEDPDDDLDF